MPIMTEHAGEVIGGVDTHGEAHHAAVIDTLGRHLADREFPATGAGYRSLECWLRSHGTVVAVGVEGTGAYGAELARSLARSGLKLKVVEVDRPDRKTRRMRGKSDPIDAYAAATAVASGRATGTPKQREGIVEAIRALRVPLRSAVKARTQAINQARQLLVTAPEALRASLRDRTWLDLARACAQLRPVDLSDPRQATKAALRHLGRRILTLCSEIEALNGALKDLTARAAPELIALKGVGPDVAGQLLATTGDNPDRLRSEAAFAHLCGVAPIPASSGRKDRHRLNRGGDRAANRAWCSATGTISITASAPAAAALAFGRVTRRRYRAPAQRCGRSRRPKRRGPHHAQPAHATRGQTRPALRATSRTPRSTPAMLSPHDGALRQAPQPRVRLARSRPHPSRTSTQPPLRPACRRATTPRTRTDEGPSP